MANPLVALVGRPNVGKSTFFNRVVGRKISITEDRPGVTRDRLYADATWAGKHFTVVDTGGIELKSEDIMWKEIAKQAEVAIETDAEYAKQLRKDMTPWERKLWYCFLKDYPIRFQRQKCIDNFIADFYCFQAKLVVELDGGGHYDPEAQKKDERKRRCLNVNQNEAHGL